ncbi:hypothetical protein FT643_19090 [Ketobacter sp. MCCC 1A13808]|uniref:hypothetical protein n=1 Tax=Ketobacter sp. MCCC 1A13808 TaxID=2602738 RepID=UPI000F2AE00A|nr:hypothetical protein [Ketobacter sp. MCCC 1A13808]MVF14246.1 hypothetical protein [Ketobacter sp. MCCC 1A13808]RLP53497.1 MAG: hypothetical protein D6160_15315 [Ketobacter sp.]
MKNLLFPALLVSSLFLAACDVDEGGPEELGENIEETTQDAGNQIEDLCEDAKDGMDAKDTDC